MKLSALAVAVFASTALFSVTSAAGSGGVRGSIDDQTQTRRSLGVYMGFTDFAENANSPGSLQAQEDYMNNVQQQQRDPSEKSNPNDAPVKVKAPILPGVYPGGCWMPKSTNDDKCQTTGIFGGEQPLTETDCEIMENNGWADGWCVPKLYVDKKFTLEWKAQNEALEYICAGATGHDCSALVTPTK